MLIKTFYVPLIDQGDKSAWVNSKLLIAFHNWIFVKPFISFFLLISDCHSLCVFSHFHFFFFYDRSIFSANTNHIINPSLSATSGPNFKRHAVCILIKTAFGCIELSKSWKRALTSQQKRVSKFNFRALMLLIFAPSCSNASLLMMMMPLGEHSTPHC